MKYTSAEANKLLKKIDIKIRALQTKEGRRSTFNVASGEDAEELRPEFDFVENNKEIERLQGVARKGKHAINSFNLTHTLPGFDDLTVDQALIWLGQLSGRAIALDRMAEALPKTRLPIRNASIIDYEVINYRLEDAETASEEVRQLREQIQMALDVLNTTETMEIDVAI